MGDENYSPAARLEVIFLFRLIEKAELYAIMVDIV
jgi:hypothetical protein